MELNRSPSKINTFDGRPQAPETWLRHAMLLFLNLAICFFAVSVTGCRSTEQSGKATVAIDADGKTTSRPKSEVRQASFRDRLKELPGSLKKLQPHHKEAAPHLGTIYSRSAQFHDGHRNPVIIIPGILGSKLTDSITGQVIWGRAGYGVTNPSRAEDARLLALPIKPTNRPLRLLTDNDVADSILGDVDLNLFGFTIEVGAYRGILSTLGVGGYRDDTGGRATLDSISYGKDHYTCFEFHYDWRRENSESAARLNDFIKEKAEYVRRVRKERFGVEGEPVKFDIVAHSMGGLVARYFLRYGNQQLPDDGSLPILNWAGAKDVETLILVGTPSTGSAEGLQSLVDGIKYSPVLPKYPPAILGTMPSIYQLLPRPRHAIVVNENSGAPIDVYDWREWKRFRWGLLNPKEDVQLKKILPNVESRSEREVIAVNQVKKALFRAKQFHQALDLRGAPPAGTSINLIAGDAKDTISKLTVNPQTGIIKIAAHAAGDGTVLRSSALSDERLDPRVDWSPRLASPIAWRQITFLFTDHLGLTSDPAFTDNVLFMLLEMPKN